MNWTVRSQSSAVTLATLIVLATSGVGVAKDKASKDQTKSPKLESVKLGSTRNVHSFEKNLLCGQPSAEDFAEAKKRGIKVVITLRTKAEVAWDEPAAMKELGLDFHRFGFRAPDTLTDTIFDRSLKILANSKKAPVMLHCGSANRVGAIWLAHRVLNDGIMVEDARKEAKTVGLRTAGYEKKALAYIKRTNAKKPRAVDEGKLPDGIKCVVCGKPAKREFSVKFKSGRVYLACPNCVAAFKANPDDFDERVMAQLVATDQVNSEHQ